MTSSVWRFAHLALAVVSFLFLIIASVTGVILAVDAVNEKTPNYKADSFNTITLAQTLPQLRETYPEILELSIDHNQFVTIEGFDEEGNDFKFIANPTTGKELGKPIVKSNFIQWVTALHRSLFLHETGRFIVGIISFLLLLITISGTVLIIKRQLGVKKFFGKITRDFFAQYFHVATGRLLLIPILIIALTGTYLFLVRFDVIHKPNTEPTAVVENSDEAEEIPLKDFPVFKTIHLADVVKVEFPFVDDPEEFFKIKLKDKELLVHQLSGKIVSETKYPTTTVLETLSLDLHTGRTNSIWAIILGVASLNILFFIYSGFVITFKRKGVSLKNKFKANDADYIILVGSENGSTLFFANKLFTQLLTNGKKAYLTHLNNYQPFNNASQFIVLTSTYGSGDAPSNADKFEKLLKTNIQPNNIQFSVIGFGSKKYEDYCAFAYKVHQLLSEHKEISPLMDVYTVNEKSPNEFVQWIKDYTVKTQIPLTTTPAVYEQKTPKLQSFKVIEKIAISENDQTFQIVLKPNKKTKFQSGDLLAIYPENNNLERFYSIAKKGSFIHLIVKLHEKGLGSNFLHNLTINQITQAVLVKNKSFYFPKKATEVVLIANGTGIAPFLGMIEENIKKTPLYLYAGFRYNTISTNNYEGFLSNQKNKGCLNQYHFTFSRENENNGYVMHLIERDADFFANILKTNGVVMICGSLSMQKDVEAVLNKICLNKNNKPLDFYKENHQIKTDCY